MDAAKRNYRLSVLNGVSFGVGETFIDPSTVLVLLVSTLTPRGWIVGLAVALTEIGWYLPQILTIRFLEQRSRRLPVRSKPPDARRRGKRFETSVSS